MILFSFKIRRRLFLINKIKKIIKNVCLYKQEEIKVVVLIKEGHHMVHHRLIVEFQHHCHHLRPLLLSINLMGKRNKTQNY